MKKLISVFAIISSLIMPVYAETDIEEVISDTALTVLSAAENPQISSIGGEWAVIGLLKSGAAVPSGYFERYYENAENTVRDRCGVLSSRKYTEYSRVVTALALIGKDPENVAGYNLVSPICDFDAVTYQGINGSIWALIALDSGGFGDNEIRDRFLKSILDKECENGGWTLSGGGGFADSDVTAMTLTALSKYTENENVASAVARGIDCLAAMQNDDGGFSTYGEATAESIAQVITALSALGKNAEEFTKNGNSPIDALLKYYKKGVGFAHIMGGEPDLMATEQALYALASVKCFKEGGGSVFCKNSGEIFTDISGNASKTAILSLYKKGVISGMGNGSFAPSMSVTRAEFATMAVKAAGILGDSYGGFCDVHKTDWFCEYVGAAYKCGIVFGVSETEFDPYGKITCEEAAAMLARTAKILGIDAETQDNAEITGEISDWAAEPYNFCKNAGILSEEIPPKKTLKRDEIAQMIYNMLEKAEIL